ncbi:MAG: DUF1738 domain-containing protein [Desulfobulbaceae bacterium]|nr:DUF1738 domain-containing protein [Desulfobulbaceae bacterium]
MGNPNVYEIITEQVLEIMSQGVIPWKKPWNARSAHRNLITGKQYRGINVFILSCTGFSSPWWLSFKQAKEKGGMVRKGEKGRQIVFWKPFLTQDTETGKDKKVFMLRYYTVFNLDQIEGVEAPQESETIELEPIAEAERIVSEMQNRPTIEEAGGNKACYYPGKDSVQMPFFQDFDESEKYYSVLFHELGHSTGHVSRLARKEVQVCSRFGSEDYSKEELVAEMTAAFICGESGILPATVENSAEYLQSWSAKLKDDKKMVINAAAAAQRAADYILNRNFTEQE